MKNKGKRAWMLVGNLKKINTRIDTYDTCVYHF